MKNIVLASASPRRAELLRRIGLDFRVLTSSVDEREIREKDPARRAECLALAKAKNVASALQGTPAVIIGADTIVCVDGEILGKPADSREAARMLRLLSGRSHQVMTGVAVVRQPDGSVLSCVETTTVYMRHLSDREIDWYVKSGEAFDKAGGYGIQGRAAVFIERVEGCYFNVVGLPLAALWQLLKKLGGLLPEEA
ncbi:MAG: Maf family protein [Bacillota bacterium]|jgi:septum formation protein|nr:Maf family protein [Bacillota bacterium]HHU30963.1 septum formation inhibitor Maf [Bacillota bacterium]